MAREDDLLDQRHSEVLGAIGEVRDHLKTLDGRTRGLENKVSVLSWAYTLMAAAAVYAWNRLMGHQ